MSSPDASSPGAVSTGSSKPSGSLSPVILGVLGLSTTFVALGMGRFSFTPLMPMLVSEGTASKVEIPQVAALMMAGYTLGAIVAAWCGRRFGARLTIRCCLVVITAALLGEALPVPLAVHALLRFLCGAAGALLVVLAPALLLQAAGPGGRGRVAGLTYTGIGLGTLVSGAVVPLAVTVSTASLALGVLSAIAMVGSLWLPADPVKDHAASHAPATTRSLSVGLITIAYALDAFAYVPHTALWGTFVAQELGRGVAVAGHHWVLFGLGAMCGPLLTARVAGWIGFQRALALGLAVKASLIALPWLSQAPWALVISITGVGAMVPGTVTLLSGRLMELDPKRMAFRWGFATSAFAIVQAAAGWTHAALYAHFGSYLPLFPIAAGTLFIGALLAAFARERPAS